ncbi:MAG: Gfo/Idh/MocA family oxidoreductase [Acidimicrobiales bacterium]|jgi:myo-inositol 2-dehydrogenase/D-chiro-inositol 1-dehydrogenase
MDSGGFSTSASPNGHFQLGLVGAGRMGRTHLEVLEGSPGIAIAGVAEPREDVRAALPATVRSFASLPAMLGECELDGVLVAAPTDLHLEIVRRLMAERLPVLCEKPCGLTVEETDECAHAAEEAGCILQVAYWRRFVPELQRLRERIAAGELGEILAVNCQQWDASPPAPQFRHRSGGIFIDMGVHEFDQIRWLTGQEFETLQVAVSRFGSTVSDPDCGQIVAELAGGSTAAVSLGRWHPAGDSCKVDVFGTAGTETSWFLRPVEGNAVFLQALRLQAEDFVRAVSGGGGTGATVTDAVAALKVAMLASESIAADLPA